MTHTPPCRFCGTPLTTTFVDLGLSPLSNSYVDPADVGRGEHMYPLHTRVCGDCWLVQLEEFESPDAIFSDYAYFSSYSDSWLAHCAKYVDHMCADYGIGADSQVVELASNDGYLLQYFAQRGVPVLGVEPAANVAAVAREKGITTRVDFFGVATADTMVAEGQQADLLLGNNVLAHVPDLNDFVAGMKRVLKPGGVLTMEFPHLLRLIENVQYDTIYHEHFSYLSAVAVERIFRHHGLALFDVRELPTHGGSLRIYAAHVEAGRPTSAALTELLARETAEGLTDLATYTQFTERVYRNKRDLLRFLIDARDAGKRVVGYGAPAKGNTMLNYCGVRTDLLDYTVDRSPHKQGKLLPGTQIPIHTPERIAETKPDYVLILPWNLKDEIMQQMAHIRDWGGRFVVAIPDVEVSD